MKKIDFHSHILPGIDDGARNPSTSMEMLRLVAAQHVDIMAATPHFYASRDRISTFLENRERAWGFFSRAMQAEPSDAYPVFVKGAEVAFFDGISRAKEIERLTIEHTNILLLEMLFTPWTAANLKEVEDLVKSRGLRVLIAHIERFLWMPGNKGQAKELLSMPVSIQVNAEAFTDFWHRRALVRMFEEGQAHVLGSDCHGAHHRIPNLEEGRDFLRKKGGSALLEKIDRQGERYLLEGAPLAR